MYYCIAIHTNKVLESQTKESLAKKISEEFHTDLVALRIMKDNKIISNNCSRSYALGLLENNNTF
jgi:hypothetical protein